MTDAFWTGGMAAFDAGLRETYSSLLSDLRSQLDHCTEEERAAFELEIEEVEAEYKTKLEEAGNHLY